MFNPAQILTELYELDPELKAHESALIKLIAELSANRPVVEPDNAWRQRLRLELMSRARQLQVAGPPVARSFFTTFLIMPKLAFAIGGVAAIALIAVAAVSYLKIPLIPAWLGSGQPGAIAFAPHITQVGKGAFGNLASLSVTGAPATASLGLGGGGALKMAPQPATMESRGSATSLIAPAIAPDGGPVPSGIMRPYYQPSYRFVYQGDQLTNLPDEVDVLKRLTGPQNMPAASSIVRSLKFTGLNMNSFADLGVAQLTLNQDQPYGYSLYLDLVAGSLNVSQNWVRWPQPGAGCQDQTCYDSFRLKESDVPSDAVVLQIARDFLAARGVSMDNLGEPYVMDDWRMTYLKMPMSERANFYIPDMVNVLFPLQLNGREVFEGGNKAGVGVGISLRDKRATGLWNLTTQQYQASSYPAETDAAKIISLAEQGEYGYGYGGPMPLMKAGAETVVPSLPPQTASSNVTNMPLSYPLPVPDTQPQVKAVEVYLGTPIPAYLKTWQYQPSSYSSDEHLVPALAFPIIKVPEGVEVYQKFVVVPLAKDFWNQGQGGPIRIMPAGMGGGTSSDSAGSAVTQPALGLPEPGPVIKE